MSQILYDEVPTVDLNDFTSSESTIKQNFVRALGDAFANIGFVAVETHGLSDEMTQKLYRSVEAFLPYQKRRS